MTVAIARTEHDAAGLRALAWHEGDAKVARRLLALALAMVMERFSRTDAASATGMVRQTLRGWVHRYNDNGVVGLSNQPHLGGREPIPSQEQPAGWVRQRPRPEARGRRCGALAFVQPPAPHLGSVLYDPG